MTPDLCELCGEPYPNALAGVGRRGRTVHRSCAKWHGYMVFRELPSRSAS